MHADAEAARRALGRVLRVGISRTASGASLFDLMHPQVVTSRRDPRLRTCAARSCPVWHGSEGAAAAGAWPAPASPWNVLATWRT